MTQDTEVYNPIFSALNKHTSFVFFPGNKGKAANTDMKFIYQPVAAIFRVV